MDNLDVLLDKMIEDAEQERDLARRCLDRFGNPESLGTNIVAAAITVEALRRFKEQGGLNDPFSLPVLVEAES